jgi:hypothetical protein
MSGDVAVRVRGSLVRTIPSGVPWISKKILKKLLAKAELFDA